MKIFAKIRFYWGALVISFVTGGLMIPAIMVFNKHRAVIMHKLNRVTLFFMNAKLKQIGKMDPDADMYLMNHQGIMDIVGMVALQEHDLRWVAKKELFDTFWFGNLFRYANMISVNRQNKAGLIKLLKDVKESKESLNRPVAIFPEGTRAKDQKLIPFKQGTKMIAKKLKLKVQPVIITGSKWVLNEHEKTGHSGTIYYIFLPTIDVDSADENWYELLQEEMQRGIDDEYAKYNRSR